MTGRLDLAAIYLFAIIFYWTPPHFWALALIKQADYARAGDPDDAGGAGRSAGPSSRCWSTRCMLLPLTIMPTLFGALGPVLRRGRGLAAGRAAPLVLHPAAAGAVVTPVAWQMYRYSLLYLALLFVAMGIDRALPFGRPAPAAKVIILGEPGGPMVPGGAIHPDRPRNLHHASEARRNRELLSLVTPSPRPVRVLVPAVVIRLTRLTDACPKPRWRPPAQARPPGTALATGAAVPRHPAARDGRPGPQQPRQPRLPDGVVRYLLDAAVRRSRSRAARPHRPRPGGPVLRPGGAQLRPGVPAERRPASRRWPGSAARCSRGCSRCRRGSSPSGGRAS